MKSIPVILGCGLSLCLLGCATAPVAVAPVGPNPSAVHSDHQNGQLEVFSALIGHSEGDNPSWYQHADYTIFDPLGKEIEHVRNAAGRYASGPRLISLPPGQYVVQATAKDYWRVSVPVVIEPGRVTRVHLDDAWRPPGSRKTELVSLPTGNPVGWAANLR